MSLTEKKLVTTVPTKEEIYVQDCIVSFSTYLPTFVDNLKNIKNEIAQPTRNLNNLSEQLRHINKFSSCDAEDFQEMHNKLNFKVATCIEEELSIISKIIERFQNNYKYLKNKIMLLESSTLKLDWNRDSDLINGTATQPKLSLLLELCLQFWTSISTTYRNVISFHNHLDVRNEETVTNFCNSFKFKVDSDDINYLLAITQYLRS